jgi:hypothetical protein
MDYPMLGMPAGFQTLLDRKYAILQQQADTAKVGVDAAAALDRTRAQVLPDQAAADVAESRARTTNLGLTGQTILPLATANLGLIGAQTTNLGAETENTTERTIGLRQLNRRRPIGDFGLGGGSSLQGGLTRLGF